jgi:hypothetical protein
VYVCVLTTAEGAQLPLLALSDLSGPDMTCRRLASYSTAARDAYSLARAAAWLERILLP